MKSRYYYLTFILSLVIFAQFGCSKAKVPGLVPCEGVITYDGVPLQYARIMFMQSKPGPQTQPAAGYSDVNGKFKLQTLGDAGILPGEYIILVSKHIEDTGPQALDDWKKKRIAGEEEQKLDPGVRNVISVIPQKYTDAKKPEIVLTIEKGGNRDLKLELKN